MIHRLRDIRIAHPASQTLTVAQSYRGLVTQSLRRIPSRFFFFLLFPACVAASLQFQTSLSSRPARHQSLAPYCYLQTPRWHRTAASRHVAGTVLLLLDQSLAPYCYPDSIAGTVLLLLDQSLASYCYPPDPGASTVLLCRHPDTRHLLLLVGSY